MKISPIRNISFKNNAKNCNFRVQKNVIISDANVNNTKDIYLIGNIKNINSNNFPDYLYLDLDELYDALKRRKPYERFEDLSFILTEALAKRCNYLGITECARGDYFGSVKTQMANSNKKYLSISECFDKKTNSISIDFDWTKNYAELEKFFNGKNNRTVGAKYDMEDIKKGLPKILKKQGWIK